MRKKWIIAVLAAALLALPGLGLNLAQAAPAYTGWAPATDLSPLHPAGFAATGTKGHYLAGDLHNHTPFSDGTSSVPLLVGKAMQNLDWFAQSGHGGKYPRDGRYSDPEGNGSVRGEGKFLDETVGAGSFKGDDAGLSGGHKNMWRWQSIQSHLYPVAWQNAITLQKPIWSGVEWDVPGHEHCSAGCIEGQFQVVPGKIGNANALAQFEYLFDYVDNDTSQDNGKPGSQNWGVKVLNSSLTDGAKAHQKAVDACKWMERNHQLTSYLLFTHTERKGAWKDMGGGNNTGYNVEHFRDFNNAAPHVCFGFETMPGHQAERGRGGYDGTAFGGGAYGGTGYYAAQIGYMWDAMLGEGRAWWLFGSSDFHSRSVSEEYDSVKKPAPDPNSNSATQNPATIDEGWRGTSATKADFWPGEYQKDYVFVKSLNKPTPQDILNGMRSGNSFVVQGDLIRGLDFTANAAGLPANMGEKLTVGPNQKVTIKVRVHVPDVNNNCPYADENLSLAQVNLHRPLNRPVLDHVDLIYGEVTGKKTPGTAAYKDPANPTAIVQQTVYLSDMKDEGKGWKSFSLVFKPTTSCYFRLQGTNMPPNTPNETDAGGNPKLDQSPNTDKLAWADLWFYSNPIFVKVVGVKNAVDF